MQTIKVECLDRGIVISQDHVDYLVSQFGEHYNERRAHRSRDSHLPPKRKIPAGEWSVVKVDEVVCRERLGGVIATFERRAA